MSRTSYQTRIRNRAAELRNLIAHAQAELRELEVAEKVLERLAAGEASEAQDDAVPGERTTREPTVADMAIKTLNEFGPMSSTDLLETLQGTWRPDLAQTTLTSTLSRTKREGRLAFENGMWMTPRFVNKTPGVDGGVVYEDSEIEEADDDPGREAPASSMFD